MSNNHDSIARDIFQERIKKGLLGPGSDIFVDEKDRNEEIIADYPLQRYYTGVLFPEQIKADSTSDEANNEVGRETESDDEDSQNEPDNNSEQKNENYNPKKNEANEDDELKTTQNTFFPTNLGLTFCIDNQVKENYL